mmetsp:Transcript_18218/g.27946  ORF Transcript_18218/g.27946 Transcript_18218/m.27946 type:complete len:229 (+) Transcript_18218:80-766(+)
MHTTTHHSSNGGLASYLYYAIIPLSITLLIAGTTYIILSSTPQSSRLDMMHPHPDMERSYLRNAEHFMPSSSLLHGTDEFFTSLKQDDSHEKGDLLPSIWNDGFFSPLLEIDPFFKQLQENGPMKWFDPVFDLSQDEDSVSLTTSISDIPLKDISIEVIDGTVLHIHGEKNTPESHVSFDKRFALGHHLEESNIKAKLTKDGNLTVSAPKVKSGKKAEIRKITILEEL